jgi:hypothetical protein
MMNRAIKIVMLYIILVVPGGKTYAQYSNKVWCFGDSAGIVFSNPVTYFTSSAISSRGSVSIADLNDSLLFYGTSTYPSLNLSRKKGRLYNRQHQVMQNGDSLICLGWYHDILIVPKSVTDSSFYVFNAGVSGPYFGLYYSIVDLKLNNGLGAVTQKNVLIDTTATKDALMAVKHGNGKDWWLVTRKWDYYSSSYDNAFYVYLVDSNGIYPQPVQYVGTLRASNGGEITFSSNGTRMVESDLGNLIELYDFDRCTGIISNPVNIEMPSTTGPFKYYASTCFSSNDRYIYALSNLNAFDSAQIHQYDLQASNIANSKTLIGTINDSASAVMMKLAPNGKIYIASWSDLPGGTFPYATTSYNTVNTHLSTINYPDSLGSSCDFQLFSFPLGGNRTYNGLPHNPNYEMGPLVGSPCDTLSVGITPDPSEARGAWMQAWYNHEWNMIHVNAAQLKGKKGMLRLFDMEGRVVFEKPAEVIAGGYYTTEINMENLVSGVYVVNLVTEQEKISRKVGKY